MGRSAGWENENKNEKRDWQEAEWKWSAAEGWWWALISRGAWHFLSHTAHLLPNSDTSSITAITHKDLLLHSVRLFLSFSLRIALQVQQACQTESINITKTDSALHIKQISIPLLVYSHPFNLSLWMTFTSPPSVITSLCSTQSANSTCAPPHLLFTTILPHTLSLLSQSPYRHSIEQSMCSSIAPRATIQGDLVLMPALSFQRSEDEINQLETCASWRQDWVTSSFH